MVTVQACNGPFPDPVFFESFGYVGQDCESWGLLTEHMEGIVTYADVVEFSSTLRGKTHRQTKRP